MLKSFRLQLGLCVTVFFGLVTSSAQAFLPTSDPQELGRNFLGPDDQISINNPQTHGEIRPTPTGKPSTITIRFNDQQITWSAIDSDMGVLQAWGTPFVGHQPDDTIRDMDIILRQLLAQNINLFHVNPQELKLEKERTKFSGPFRYITYARMHAIAGEYYPVDKAYITFRFKFGRLIEISNYSFGKITLDETPAISAQDAIDAIVEDGVVASNQDWTVSPKPLLQPFYDQQRKIRFRLVYDATVRRAEPYGLWHYSISAVDARIVGLENKLHMSGHVSAEVYPRLPSDGITSVSLPEVTVRNGSQVGRTDTDGNYAFDPEGSSAELSGVRAAIRQSSSKSVSQQSGPDGEILFSAAWNLSENMAYVYVNRVNQFVRNFVKSAPRDTPHGKSDFLNSPITVNTRVQNKTIKGCNAWFDPDEKTLNFLEANAKCEASSHFADIIMHEWGHGFDDAFGGIQDNAFSEAIGDFTAVLMTGDPRMAPGFFKSSEDPIRRIDMVKIYPRDQSRDPHLEGLIVSGAWFETLLMMKKIYGDDAGRMKTADLFFKHLISTDAYLDSYMGVLAVDDDDGNLQNCTPHMCILNVAFAKRGLTPADPRCFSEAAPSGLPACAPSTVKPPTE
ncbi:MAG: hemagglutinin protein [Bacteriovoracaceae bacterium]|nr:hemagglutinin protein [Bacteriovoracaceae bacterium]